MSECELGDREGKAGKDPDAWFAEEYQRTYIGLVF